MFPLRSLVENKESVLNVAPTLQRVIYRNVLLMLGPAAQTLNFASSLKGLFDLSLDDLQPKKIKINNILVLDPTSALNSGSSNNYTFSISMPGLIDYDINLPSTYFAEFYSMYNDFEFSNYRTIQSQLPVTIYSTMGQANNLMNAPLILLFNIMFYY